MRRHLSALSALSALLAACGPTSDGGDPTLATPAATPATATRPGPIRLSDVTEEAGIHFVHDNHRTPGKLLPETMGSGLAFFDHDGDGRPDLYLLDAAPLQGERSGGASAALYRNVDGRRFEEVTVAAGLTDPFPAMGVAVGDVDNDGDLDLFVSGVGEQRLYRNQDGHFSDVTGAAGLAAPGFGSSAAFLDYDRDGNLDLFVGHYVTWSLEGDVSCSQDGVHRSYCTPERYRGESSRLYRNLGSGRFSDVTRATGLLQPEGKTLGVAVLDHDRDGWPDLAVANDTVRNFLYVNRQGQGFQDLAVVTELAFSESGAPRGGMGIDAADADGDGFEDVAIGNFAFEMAALYRGSASGHYSDDAAQSGIGIPTLLLVAFGTLLVDLDNDGWLDLVVANGHIEPDIEQHRPRQTYAQPLQVFRNDGRGGFELQPAVGALAAPLVGRGLAAADIDGDGDLDLAVSQNGGPARLLRNDSDGGAWIRLRPIGRTSNHTGYGLVVDVVAGERRWRRTLRSGSSYLSASEPVLTVGLGAVTHLDRIELTWPSGARQVLENPRLGETLVVEEP